MTGSRNLGPWIALAGLFVGAGLYLGLRSRPVAEPRAPGSVVAPPPAPDARERAGDEVQRDIRAAFDAFHPRWRTACWDPAVATTPVPATSAHEINLTVDATGKEILRAINDVRGQTRVDVATCLRDLPYEPIQVAAPGRSTSLVFTIQFP